MAPQSMVTKGLSARWLWSWIARATAPLPVPVSPRIRIVASVGATRSSRAKILRIGCRLAHQLAEGRLLRGGDGDLLVDRLEPQHTSPARISIPGWM